jgi:hypothetical protein
MISHTIGAANGTRAEKVVAYLDCTSSLIALII